ncbi:hypothetical protein DFQ01_121114 [Paenibacillus cellulosilyticus]|uniref:Uncharacterized protein n=1 Tax=Paenibacillus cellulosilyticus TaxID=375489 RepID=A0A2V2YNS9_9BACL|nr:hypothetical protein [Paenibacillus cellulosilyticus]PWV97470.1 hypothetical protein DFQ01_121114 [Paenibacillus cellulosilyticus]QKS48493.1 hypothetical protein HUB94_30120 [Paenibacillus cellulosilyticus]
MDKDKIAHELALIAVKQFVESNKLAYTKSGSIAIDLARKYMEYYNSIMMELE